MTTITLTRGQVQGLMDAPEERRRTKKQSEGPVGMTKKELKESKIGKRRSNKNVKNMKIDDMSYKPINLAEEQLLKRAMDSLLAKGGEFKKLKGGGLAEATAKLKAKGMKEGGMVVKDKTVAIDKSPNSGLITTKGFGASRRT